MNTLLCNIDRWLSNLYRLCGYLAGLCMVMIAVFVLLSIVTRLMSLYVPGLTEYSGYAMAAGSFLALAHTFSEKGHIRVELFLSRLRAERRHFAEIWCLSVATVITSYLAFYMARLVYYSYQFEEYSEGADAILLWKPQSLAMIGAIVLAIAVAHHLVKCLLSRNYEPR